MKKKKADYKFYGKNAYYKLIDDEKNIRKEFQDAKIIIARDSEKGKGSKNYMKFKTIDSLRLFINKLPHKDRCLYEYRTEIDNVKLFFDIDKKITTDTDSIFLDTFLETVIDVLKFSIENMWEYKYPIRKDDFYIYDSSTPAKLSYHIIVNKYHLIPKNIGYLKEIKKYATELLKVRYNSTVDDDSAAIIDDTTIDGSIYNKRGCFRLLGSHKINQKNIKKGYSRQSDINSLSKSMICMIDYSKSIEIDCSPINGWEPKIEEDLLDTEEIENQSLKNNSIEYILENLKLERADTYGEWIRVAFVLKNMGCDEELFHKFSERSGKYNKNECSKFYNGITVMPIKKRLNIGSLLMWLKEDNPKAFKNFQKHQNGNRGIRYYIDTLTINKDYIIEKGFDYIEINEKYLSYKYFNNQNDILIKSFLGTGKTNVICMLPEITDKTKNILIVPPRRLQTKDNYLRYNFNTFENGVPSNSVYMYLDNPISYNRVICQPESFHLIPIDTKYDLIILDEIESSLMQFYSDTMKTNDNEKYKRQPTNDNCLIWDRYEEACIRLKKFCKEAKRVICADAFLSKKSIETYLLFNRDTTSNTTPIFLNNLYVPEKSIVENIPIELIPNSKKEDFSPFYNKIIQELTNGKKCFCVFSSKARLDEFSSILKKNDKKIFKGKFYYGGNNSLKRFDAEKEWYGLDFVAITTTITTGIDFQSDWFDVAFVYWQSTPLIRDIFQSLYRVRHLKDKKLYFCTSRYIFRKNMNSMECNISKIKKEILDISISNELLKIHSDELFLTIKAYNIQSYRIQFLSINAYKKIIELFMGMCNIIWDDKISSRERNTSTIDLFNDIQLPINNLYDKAISTIINADNIKDLIIRNENNTPLEKEILSLVTFIEKFNIDIKIPDIGNVISEMYHLSKEKCGDSLFDKYANLFKFIDGEWKSDGYLNFDITNPKIVEIGRYSSLSVLLINLNINLDFYINECISNNDIKKLNPLKLKKSLETLFYFRDVKRDGDKRIRVLEKDVTIKDNWRYLKHIFDYFSINLKYGRKKKKVNGKQVYETFYNIIYDRYLLDLNKLRSKNRFL